MTEHAFACPASPAHRDVTPNATHIPIATNQGRDDRAAGRPAVPPTITVAGYLDHPTAGPEWLGYDVVCPACTEQARRAYVQAYGGR